MPGRIGWKAFRDRGMNRTLFISLLAHSVFIAAMAFSAQFPTKKLTFGPVYNVDLVSPMQGVNTRTAAPISSEIKSLPRSQPVALKKQDSPTAFRKDDGRQVQRAIDDLRKKSASPAPQPSPAPNPQAAAGGGAENSARLNAYYALVWSRIKSQWALPRGIMQSDNLEAVIDVKIQRDGTVARLGIEKSSGNRYFDQSALKAVRKASPFPPLPAIIQEANAEFGIRFHSSEGH